MSVAVRREGRGVAVEYGPENARKTALFRLGINEMIAVQEEWGITSDHEFLATLDNLPGLGRYRVLMKHALRASQPDITLEQVGDLITELGMPKMKEIFVAITEWAFPERASSDAAPATPGKGDAASPGPLPS